MLFSIVFFIILIANLVVVYWRGIGVTLAILAETIGGGLIAAIAFFPSDEKGGLLAVGAQFTALALAGTISGIANMSIAVAISRSLMWRGALIFTSITALLGIIFGVILGGANDTSYIVSSLIAMPSLHQAHMSVAKPSKETENTPSFNPLRSPPSPKVEPNFAAPTSPMQTLPPPLSKVPISAKQT